MQRLRQRDRTSARAKDVATGSEIAPRYCTGYTFDTLPRRTKRFSTRNDQRRPGLDNFRHGLPNFVIRSSSLDAFWMGAFLGRSRPHGGSGPRFSSGFRLDTADGRSVPGTPGVMRGAQVALASILQKLTRQEDLDKIAHRQKGCADEQWVARVDGWAFRRAPLCAPPDRLACNWASRAIALRACGDSPHRRLLLSGGAIRGTRVSGADHTTAPTPRRSPPRWVGASLHGLCEGQKAWGT
jgi:hypothetical protein